MTMWTTRDGRRMAAREMEDRHLLNTHRVVAERLEYQDDPDDSVWMMEDALEEEIDRRGLKPLPIRSRALSESVQGVSALRTWWPHMGAQDKRDALRSVASFLRNVVKTDEARMAADCLDSEPK